MTASGIVSQFQPLVIAVYWWLIPLMILGSISKTAFMKGVFGEFQVNLAARIFLDKRQYVFFKNVTLKTEDGTTQIDHIIVSRYGLFVIETKNMTGWIFGAAHQKTWTQKMRYSYDVENGDKRQQSSNAVLRLFCFSSM